MRNDGEAAIAIARAWHPHARFRSRRRALGLRVPGGHFVTFALPVRIDVRLRETVDNPFLILEVAHRRERWRILARLRLRGGTPPRVTVEAVDAHPATD